LYAEDPSNNFLPVTGKIQTWKTTDLTGLRYDSAVESGSEISIFYDPMIAKIIAHGPDRLATIRSMQYAMSQLVCLGLTTNQAFLNQVLHHPDFIAGKYDTHFIQNQLGTAQFGNLGEISWQHALIGATLQVWKKTERERGLLQHLPSGWRNNFYQPQEIRLGAAGKEWIIRYRQKEGGFQFFIDDAVFAVECLATPDHEQLRFVVDGLQRTLSIVHQKDQLHLHWPQYGNLTIEVLPRFPIAGSEELPGTYQSPMPGEIIEVLVSPGQVVASGDSLILLSSMKMENTIAANAAGTVEEVFVQAGQRIEAGFLLLKISEN
jgi:3-methylcrotonyl-CoA carboxylase alpha subunit